GLVQKILSLACGASSAKLHVGNYGTNYPVKDIKRDKTWLTTQSRHYYIVEESIRNKNLKITHRSLNDQTIEGLFHTEYPAFSVQFNLEGVHSTNKDNFLFDQFNNLI